MNAFSLAGAAVGNSLRSMSRTILTVLAIFIGAFTLTLTTAVGNGINAYIDTTTSSLGGGTTLTVTKTPEQGDGPAEYETGTTTVTTDGNGPEQTVETITSGELRAIRDLEGVVKAEPVRPLDPDYIAHDGGQTYQLRAAGLVPGTTLPLVAGEQLDQDSKTRQIAIPESYVDPLDFADAEDALDQTVTIGITDADGKQTTVTATVVAVVRATLANADTATANDALVTTLYDRQSVGLTDTAKNSYAAVTVELDEGASADDVTAVKDSLADEGYTGETVDDQIGDFKTVIDAVVLILNGFAVIALLAAGFGIVNTLLMSVRERTREIGLMKAMGLGGGRIFAMFSLEAVFIGLLGSLIGVDAAVVTGTIANSVLGTGLLAGLEGLTLLVFSPATIAAIIGLVMGIAFIAGSIPAWRAARQDPIESLRYE